MREEDLSKLEETAGRDDRIDEIIARYLDACESGSGPSVEEILARYPQYEKELREFFTNENLVREALTPRDRPYFGDDYDLLEEIGRGGMGVVYKCHQKSLDKVVAIKTIIGGTFVTPEDIERIRKEAQKAAGVRHPNIVTVHQVAQHKGKDICGMANHQRHRLVHGTRTSNGRRAHKSNRHLRTWRDTLRTTNGIPSFSRRDLTGDLKASTRGISRVSSRAESGSR